MSGFGQNEPKKSMKVLFVEPCYKNFGGYFRAINICKSLSQKNIKVVLLLSSNKKFAPFIKKTIINKNLIQYELPRISINFYINGRFLRGIMAILFGIFGNFDIIHCAVPSQIESNLPAFFLKLLNKKIIIDWDDLMDSDTIENKLLRKYVKFCELFFPKIIKNYIVTSDFLYNLAKKRGAKNIIKIINGIDNKQFKLQKPKININFLTFGNTYYSDRTRLLLLFFKKIIKLKPEARLIWNLDPKILIKQQNLKINQKILKQIDCVGNIPQKKLGHYIASSQAIIFLMGNMDSEKACFPIRIGSYLNGEAIIIINDTNTEAVNTLKKYNCAIVDKNLNKLAKKTLKILNSPKLRKKIKSNIKRAKKELLWDNLIIPLINYYKEI